MELMQTARRKNLKANHEKGKNSSSLDIPTKSAIQV